MTEASSVEQLIHGHLSRSLARFWEVGVGQDVLVSGIAALDGLLAAASLTDRLYAADPSTCIQLAEAMERATPVLANSLHELLPERVYTLASAAVAMLSDRPDALHADRALYAAALRMEIALEACRCEIASRGDPIMRVIAINRALAEQPADHPIH